MKKPLAARRECLGKKLAWSIWHCVGIVVSLDEGKDNESSKTSSYLYWTPCLTFSALSHHMKTFLVKSDTVAWNCWAPLSESFWQELSSWPYFDGRVPGYCKILRQVRMTSKSWDRVRAYNAYQEREGEARPSFTISIKGRQWLLDQIPDPNLIRSDTEWDLPMSVRSTDSTFDNPSDQCLRRWLTRYHININKCG